MKLLLHTCCGPCFLGVWEELSSHKGIDTTLYYDNPNIYPKEEWERRRDNLRLVANKNQLQLVEAIYEPDKYQSAIGVWQENGIENLEVSQEFRCPKCYRLRLERAARFAKENGYDAISTTLFVSPYQQHEVLKKVAQDVANDYGVVFYYTDWRPYFREGQNTAREMNIYRQKYCGCKYSIAESKKK